MAIQLRRSCFRSSRYVLNSFVLFHYTHSGIPRQEESLKGSFSVDHDVQFPDRLSKIDAIVVELDANIIEVLNLG
jgi:hypothetical protein